MVKKRHWIGLSLAAAVLLIGCEDDGGGSRVVDVTPECSADARECTPDGKQRVCVDSVWETRECSAGQTCSGGECLGGNDGEECRETDAPVCSGKTARIVCKDGKKTSEPCTGDTECVAGECVKACPSDAAATCDDGVAKWCEAGDWKEENCTEKGLACENGRCVESFVICMEETFESECGDDGKSRSVCLEGRESFVLCSEGEVCDQGVCHEPYPPCTEDALECEDDRTVRKCVDGEWSFSVCRDENAVCREGECVPGGSVTPCLGSEPECVDGESRAVCVNDERREEKCAPGLVCRKGECEQPVTPGSKCDEAFKPYCLDDGAVAVCQDGEVVSVPCGDKICSVGACVDKPCGDDFKPECRNGAELLVCRDSVVKVEACPDGELCVNGGCRPLQEGDGCTPETFPNVCLDRTNYYSCSEKTNTIEKLGCNRSEVCLNGMCSKCDPETFETVCDGGDSTKNTFITCVEDEKTPGYYIQQKDACPKSNSICLEGNCVQCDPETYKPFCSDNQESKCDATGKIIVTPCADGLKCVSGFAECTNKCATEADCPKRGDGLKYKCEDSQCVLITECDVAADKPTCSGDRRRVCQAPGKWVESVCDGNKVCHGAGECVECTADKHCSGSKPVCDTATHTCVPCLEDKHCTSKPGVCLNKSCVQCNPATYGTQCVDNAPATCNAAGTIVKGAVCSGQYPACVNGQCRRCDGSVDAGKIICDFPGHEGYAATCRADNNMEFRECAPNETCKPGKGCVSKCGDSFKETCADINDRYICDDSGNKVKQSCWPGVCNGGKCTDDCSGNIDKCGVCDVAASCKDYLGKTMLRTCKSGKVNAVIANSNQFCGTVNGELGVHEKCESGSFSIGLNKASNCETSDCKVNGGRDYQGNYHNAYVPASTGAVCEKFGDYYASSSCYKTVDGEIMLRRLPCEGGCTDGICSNWKKLSSNPGDLPATITCAPVAYVTGNAYTFDGSQYYEEIRNCRSYKASAPYDNPKCIAHKNDYDKYVGTCDHEYTHTDGITYKLGGTCVGKKLYQLMIFKIDSGFSVKLASQECKNKCKTTSTGWAYCGK